MTESEVPEVPRTRSVSTETEVPEVPRTRYPPRVPPRVHPRPYLPATRYSGTAPAVATAGAHPAMASVYRPRPSCPGLLPPAILSYIYTRYRKVPLGTTQTSNQG